jgi:hypothetical protein
LRRQLKLGRGVPSPQPCIVAVAQTNPIEAADRFRALRSEQAPLPWLPQNRDYRIIISTSGADHLFSSGDT